MEIVWGWQKGRQMKRIGERAQRKTHTKKGDGFNKGAINGVVGGLSTNGAGTGDLPIQGCSSPQRLLSELGARSHLSSTKRHSPQGKEPSHTLQANSKAHRTQSACPSDELACRGSHLSLKCLEAT